MKKVICKICGNKNCVDEQKIDGIDGIKYVACNQCNSDLYFCSECGEELRTKRENLTSGLFCDKCNEWKVVTTYIPPKGND